MKLKIFIVFLIFGYARSEFEGNKIIQIENKEDEPDVHVTSPDNGVKVHIVMKRIVEDGLIGTEIIVTGPNFVKKTIELTDPEGGRKFVAHMFEKHIGVVDANTFNQLLENIIQAVQSNNIHPAFYQGLRIANIRDLDKLNPEDIFDRIDQHDSHPDVLSSNNIEQGHGEKEVEDTLQDIKELGKDKEEIQVAKDSLKQKISLDKDIIQEKEISGDSAGAENAVGDLLDKQATIQDLNDLQKKVESKETKLAESVENEESLDNDQENYSNRNNENPIRLKIINIGENPLQSLQSPPIISQDINNEPILEQQGNGLNEDINQPPNQLGHDRMVFNPLAFFFGSGQRGSGYDLPNNNQNSQPQLVFNPSRFILLGLGGNAINPLASLFAPKQPASGDDLNQENNLNSQQQSNVNYNNIIPLGLDGNSFNPLAFILPWVQPGSGKDLNQESNRNGQSVLNVYHNIIPVGPDGNAFNPFVFPLGQSGFGNDLRQGNNQNNQPQSIVYHYFIPLRSDTAFNPLASIFPWRQQGSDNDLSLENNLNSQQQPNDSPNNVMGIAQSENALNPLASLFALGKQGYTTDLNQGTSLNGQPEPIVFPDFGPNIPERAVNPDLARDTDQGIPGLNIL